MSLEALRGTPTPLDERIHAARPHAGQVQCAAMMRELVAESDIRESHRSGDDRVQDAYSLRCTPQVMGAVLDAFQFARRTLDIELNASTDNPLVFENGEVLSGGNFHGQPVAMALDLLAIATAELANISERRIEQLVNPALSSGLPAFLAYTNHPARFFLEAHVMDAYLSAPEPVFEVIDIINNPRFTEILLHEKHSDIPVIQGSNFETFYRRTLAEWIDFLFLKELPVHGEFP
jgi:histidine ammonia-lyase